MATGGKWGSRAPLVERTERRKDGLKISFHSWRVESCPVGREQMDQGSDRVSLGGHSYLKACAPLVRQGFVLSIEQVFLGGKVIEDLEHCPLTF